MIQPHPRDLTPALRVAVAVTTAVGMQPPAVSAEELVGDIDPLEVVAVLGIALHATLGVTLGDEGRSRALAGIGLDVAGDRS